jgi:hypothetical protein
VAFGLAWVSSVVSHVWRGFYHEFNFLHNLGYSPLAASGLAKTENKFSSAKPWPQSCWRVNGNPFDCLSCTHFGPVLIRGKVH